VQSNPDKGEDADAAAEVVIYSLQVEHTPWRHPTAPTRERRRGCLPDREIRRV